MKLKSEAYSYKIEAMNLLDGTFREKKTKQSSTADRYISEAESKFSADRYKPQELLRVVFSQKVEIHWKF